MYEDQTFDAIMERMLERVPNSVDKREGSIMWNALAPAAAELTQMYIELGINLNLGFADTATGEYLSRRTAEFGVNREPATKAIRQGQFYSRNNEPMDIPIGSRFSVESVNFVAIEKISTGIYRMECEQAGTIGNSVFGNMLPIQNINGLARAELGEVLIPGQNEESDEDLRRRYYEIVNEPSFGGNVADYKQKINSIDGVGDSKVFPVWDGGGTVKCTIIAADWNAPSSALVDEVQTIIDPTVNQGKGLGWAPIDHKVTIAGVTDQTIDIETSLHLEPDVTIGQVQSEIENAISDYFLSLRKDWANQEEIIIRIAMIDARILSVSGVVDIEDTKLNGSTSNITLDAEVIPKIGTVTLEEG